jgi:hypothetical protein
LAEGIADLSIALGRRFLAEESAIKPLRHYSSLLSSFQKDFAPGALPLKNQGVGMSDGGLFTPDQLQKGGDAPLEGQPPARGAIECKGAKEDA